jgi:transposase-like protein
MCHIIPNILTLVQAKYNLLYEKVDKCEHCNKLNPWKHGTRTRKTDRESPSAESLNPINIQRYYCTGCNKTFSSIPECISPRRWYSWIAQQVVLMLFISGKSPYAIAKKCKPSYKTIKRWLARADDQCKIE